MTKRERVEQAISEVLVPGVGRSVVQLNMIRDIDITDNVVKVTLASTST